MAEGRKQRQSHEVIELYIMKRGGVNVRVTDDRSVSQAQPFLCEVCEVCESCESCESCEVCESYESCEPGAVAYTPLTLPTNREGSV